MAQTDKHPVDIGCTIATAYLREQLGDEEIHSQCLECPFVKCIEENDKNTPEIEARRTQVRQLIEQGVRPSEIARQLGIRSRLVRYYRRQIVEQGAS